MKIEQAEKQSKELAKQQAKLNKFIMRTYINLIEDLRKCRNQTKVDFARSIGMSKQHYQGLLSGRCKIDTLKRIYHKIVK
jgi:hypothetical protein